ncbi:MAG: 2-oxo acid dehydrogenase subunit E2 [Pseudomonas sp.]
MSIQPIEVPKWGLTMEEGTLSRWLVEEGQSFSKGDELCEIETSKIANALEASFDGVLRRIVVQPGVTLPVGALLAVAAPTTVDDTAIDAWLAARQGAAAAVAGTVAPVTTAPVAAAQPEPEPVVSAPQQTSQAPIDSVPAALRGATPDDMPATVHALRLAQREGIDLSRIAGSGRDGRVSVADIARAVQAAGGQLSPGNPSQTVQRGDDSAVLATPIARRLAREHAVDLRDCRATGSRGRVCRADVQAVLAGRNQRIAGEQGDTMPDLQQGCTQQSMSAMRRTIAARLQASKQDAPHYRVCMDMDLEAMLALKNTLNQATAELKLSVNDLMIKATAHALIRVPQLNAQYDPQRQVVTLFADADIAVAVSIDGGLITPIIPAANRKSLAEISGMMRDLATRAQAGTLKASEFQGGSFSISNLGMYGVSQFDAIINPPQVAILALGAAEQRAVVRDGELCVRRQMTASLSSDHRVVDGALAATFLRELKRLVETPALLMV